GRERPIEQSRTQREQRSKHQQETESPRWPHRIDAPSDLDLHHLSPLSLGRLVRGRPGTSAASESYLYGPISGKSGWITGAQAAASLAHISSSRKNGAMSTSGRRIDPRTTSTFSCDIAYPASPSASRACSGSRNARKQTTS